MTPIFTDKAALAVGVATGDTGKYAIDNVLVESDGTCVATNGCILVAVEGPEGPDDVVQAPPNASVLVPGTKAVKCSKGDKPRAERDVAIGDVLRYDSPSDGIVSYELPTPEHTRFPDWRDMIPKPHELERVITVGAEEMITALTALVGAMRRSRAHPKRNEVQALLTVTVYKPADGAMLVLGASLAPGEPPAENAPRSGVALVSKCGTRDDVVLPCTGWVHEG